MRRPVPTFLGSAAIGSDLTPEEVEFGRAMHEYKRRTRSLNPSYQEVLRVLLSLGYRKVAEETPLPVYRG